MEVGGPLPYLNYPHGSLHGQFGILAYSVTWYPSNSEELQQGTTGLPM